MSVRTTIQETDHIRLLWIRATGHRQDLPQGQDRFSCGRPWHIELGFTGSPTAEAASYPQSLAAAYAGELRKWWSQRSAPTASQIIEQVSLHSSGKVKRHGLRGEDRESQREAKSREDNASRAGARNTFDLIASWPEYPAAMLPIKECLIEAVNENTELQHLSACCGSSPSREPPAHHTVELVRSRIASLLGLSAAQGEAHHRASPWRYNLVRQVGRLAKDPDHHIADWLEHGAPCGLAVPVAPGGLLPHIDEEPSVSLDDLEHEATWTANHASFDNEADPEKPALQLLTEHLDNGFCELFLGPLQAERYLDRPVVPSPLACVSKVCRTWG